MSCTDQNTIIELTKGDDESFKIYLEDEEGHPYDLTGCTEISMKLKKADLSILELLKSLSNITILEAKAGLIEISIANADTSLLKEVQKTTFNVVVTLPGPVIKTAKFPNALSVVAREL